MSVPAVPLPSLLPPFGLHSWTPSTVVQFRTPKRPAWGLGVSESAYHLLESSHFSALKTSVKISALLVRRVVKSALTGRKQHFLNVGGIGLGWDKDPGSIDYRRRKLLPLQVCFDFPVNFEENITSLLVFLQHFLNT